MARISKLKIIIFFSVLSFLYSASFVFAAEIIFESPKRNLSLSQLVEIKVMIDTNGEELNAIEGEMSYPEELLRVEDIRDGDSIVNFWIERPQNGPANKIIFSGIIPGGYKGRGALFSIIFKTIKKGGGDIRFLQARAMRNDGQAASFSLSIPNLVFSIAEQASPIQDLVAQMSDSEPPELFEPEVARDEEAFDGRWFLVFVAQDKGWGIARYEVREGRRPFKTAASPHVLENQALDYEIAVRAIDKAGNERTVILPPLRPKFWYEAVYVKLFGLVLFLTAVCLTVKYLWKRFHGEN